jgi:hypothetical protein
VDFAVCLYASGALHLGFGYINHAPLRLLEEAPVLPVEHHGVMAEELFHVEGVIKKAVVTAMAKGVDEQPYAVYCQKRFKARGHLQ